MTGLQAFSPARACLSVDDCVPLEVLVDLRCESNDFHRLVPQTDATFHYDKFNRLRLQNNVTALRANVEQDGSHDSKHLYNQTVSVFHELVTNLLTFRNTPGPHPSAYSEIHRFCN